MRCWPDQNAYADAIKVHKTRFSFAFLWAYRISQAGIGMYVKRITKKNISTKNYDLEWEAMIDVYKRN